jgi:hypothetical protein
LSFDKDFFVLVCDAVRSARAIAFALPIWTRPRAF